MQPYYFVLLLFAVCLAYAFYRVRITLKVEKYLEYRAALFLSFIEQTEETYLQIERNHKHPTPIHIWRMKPK